MSASGLCNAPDWKILNKTNTALTIVSAVSLYKEYQTMPPLAAAAL